MAIAFTSPLGPFPGSKVRSTVPSLLRRARLKRWTRSIWLNCPPTMMRPSCCKASANGVLLIPPLNPNEGSTVPSAFNRAIRFRVKPVNIVKRPATMMRPSGCKTAAKISPSGPIPGSNDASSEPSELKRAMRLRDTPLALVKRPAAITFPSGCGTTTLIVSSVPGLGTKPTSSWPGTDTFASASRTAKRANAPRQSSRP